MKRKVYAIVMIALLVAMVGLAGACTSVAAPASPPYTVVSVKVEKINMPDDFPAILTFCYHGSRVFQSFSPKDGYAGKTISLTSQKDDTCDG